MEKETGSEVLGDSLRMTELLKGQAAPESQFQPPEPLVLCASSADQACRGHCSRQDGNAREKRN